MNNTNFLQERRGLFEQFMAVSGPNLAAEFQNDLAMAIMSAERCQLISISSSQRHCSSLLRDHIHMLRCYGDAMAWSALHPHAIRQLKKHGVRAANLCSQWDSFAGVLRIVQDIAETGVMAIASDLTHCLRLGDIVVVDNPDGPSIIECKQRLPRDGELLLGRKGRQLSRIMGTSTYLHDGVALVHGDDSPRLCIEASIESTVYWSYVEEAVRRRMSGNVAVLQPEPGHVLWAGSANDTGIPDELTSALQGFRRIAIGSHLAFRDDDPPHMPPPLAWPIPSDQRWLLSEGEIQLISMIDVQQFTQQAQKYGRNLDVDVKRYGLTIDTEFGEFLLSRRFIDDCLFNFHSISDTVDLIMQFVDKVVAKIKIDKGSGNESVEDIARNEKQRDSLRVFTVGSAADLQHLIDQSEADPHGIVMINLDVWNDILRKAEPTDFPSVLLCSPKRENG